MGQCSRGQRYRRPRVGRPGHRNWSACRLRCTRAWTTTDRSHRVCGACLRSAHARGVRRGQRRAGSREHRRRPPARPPRTTPPTAPPSGRRGASCPGPTAAATPTRDLWPPTCSNARRASVWCATATISTPCSGARSTRRNRHRRTTAGTVSQSQAVGPDSRPVQEPNSELRMSSQQTRHQPNVGGERMFFRRVVVVVAIVVVAAGFQVPAQAGRYTPRAGVTFNSPVGSDDREDAIYDKIIRSIRSTPRRHDIRIMSWNIQSRGAVNTLLRAQRRGVRVRVLMSKSNAAAIDNQQLGPVEERVSPGQCIPQAGSPQLGAPVHRLVPGQERLRACQVLPVLHVPARARHVVIQGSANLTSASTSNQWNDIYTHRRTGSPRTGSSSRIFHQMAKDRPVRPPYASWSRGGPIDSAVLPAPRLAARPRHAAAQQGQVPRGDQHKAHRTRLRIAPDVIREERGMTLGRKVRQLWQQRLRHPGRLHCDGPRRRADDASSGQARPGCADEAPGAGLRR